MDLSRIAGLNPSGVICEIMNEDGTMARVPQLIEFCRQHNIKMLTVADLIRYRMQHERYVRRVAEAALPTRYGDFRMIAYASDVDHDQHIALVRGDLDGAEPALVRVHSHCLTGDVFGFHGLRLLGTGGALAGGHRQRRSRRVSLSPSHWPRIFGRDSRRSRARCRRFIFTRAGNSIANRHACAWCSTKAASARRS